MIELASLHGLRKQKAFVKANGMGHMRTLVPLKDFRYPKEGTYALDNGKFASDKKKKPWNEAQFLEGLRRIPERDPRLLFVVVPDIVEGGNESLDFSIAWRDRLEAEGFGWMPFYLAVQDGMDDERVFKELATGRWAGIFIGGSKSFKYETTWAWVDAGHRRFKHLHGGKGLKVHLAGIYLPEDQAWARARRVDSIDSTGWSRNDTMEGYITAGRALRKHQTRISEVPA